jgi:hypothetical protein
MNEQNSGTSCIVTGPIERKLKEEIARTLKTQPEKKSTSHHRTEHHSSWVEFESLRSREDFTERLQSSFKIRECRAGDGNLRLVRVPRLLQDHRIAG